VIRAKREYDHGMMGMRAGKFPAAFRDFREAATHAQHVLERAAVKTTKKPR
jgi:hypothetical protein